MKLSDIQRNGVEDGQTESQSRADHREASRGEGTYFHLKHLVADKELDNQILREALAYDGKNHSPVKRNRFVAHVVATCKTSQRRACWAIGSHRATIRYQYRRNPDEET